MNLRSRICAIQYFNESKLTFGMHSAYTNIMVVWLLLRLDECKETHLKIGFTFFHTYKAF